MGLFNTDEKDDFLGPELDVAEGQESSTVYPMLNPHIVRKMGILRYQ
jgi:hypothetical protein